MDDLVGQYLDQIPLDYLNINKSIYFEFPKMYSQELIAGLISIGIFFILTVVGIVATFMEHKKIHVLNEATVAIIIGSIAGLIVLLIVRNNDVFTFSKDIFFYVLLPIIVFNEGYCMNKHHFFKNLFYVILYGVIATLFNFILIFGFSLLLKHAGSIYYPGGNLSQLTTFSIAIYAACISSKDSALVLSFLDFKRTPKLYSILFGEQILNDLIVFSLQKAVNQLQEEAVNDRDDLETVEILANWRAYFLLIGIIIEQILVSIMVIGGMAFTWVTKQFRFIANHGLICSALIIYSGYLSFAICEVFQFSGVVSVLLCGAILSHYLTYNLSKTGQHNSKFTIGSLSYICESFIYVYLGFSVMGQWHNQKINDLSPTFTFSQIFLMIPVCRLLSMLLAHLFAIMSRMKTRGQWRINRYEFMIIFYSGLIRGPVAYALIQNPEGNELNEGDVHNPVFISQIVTQSTTIFVVIFTTVVIGGSLHYYLDWSFSKIAESSRYSIDHPSMDASDTHLETDDNSKRIPLVNKQTTELKVYMDHKSKSQTWFKRIDENILKPALIYNYKQRREDIKVARQEMRREQVMEGSSLEESMLDDHVRRDRVNTQKKQMADAAAKGRLTMSQMPSSMQMVRGIQEEEEVDDD